MRQAHAILTFQTDGQGLVEVTADIASWLSASELRMGTVTLFCQHTSASLLITENASSAVKRDLLRWLGRAVPEGGQYEHDCEGPDDMPAHIKAMLTGTGLVVPLADGKMLLGTWQGVYLAEHRHGRHKRYVVCHAMGD